MSHRPMSYQTRFLLTLTMFVASGCVYYSQPILPQIADSLGVSHLQAGLISSVTLLGFGLGLLLVAPLADVLDKRKLMGDAARHRWSFVRNSGGLQTLQRFSRHQSLYRNERH